MSEQLQVVVLRHHALTRMGLTHLIEIDAGRARVVESRAIGDELPHCDTVIYDLAGREPSNDHYLRKLIATRVAVIVLQPESGHDFSESLLAMGAADSQPLSLRTTQCAATG
jgi:DNA-binding NarL/FixJ family response regulator